MKGSEFVYSAFLAGAILGIVMPLSAETSARFNFHSIGQSVGPDSTLTTPKLKREAWRRVALGRGSASGISGAVSSPAGAAGGTINFNNYVPGSGIKAPIFDADGATRLAGSAFVAQLWAGPTTNALESVSAAFPFRGGAAAGYINVDASAVVVLTSVPAGFTAYLQVKAWETAFGSTYEEATAAGGRHGESSVFAVTAGGAGEPPGLPADLTGLTSFRLVGPPLIQEQPIGGSLFVGETASLQGKAINQATITYQWRFNGAPLVGATNSALVLPNIQLSQAGSYSVVLSSSDGSATSSNAVLAVLVPPTGASVRFSNRVPSVGVDAPVFSSDGRIRLAGPGYLAQLYAGATSNNLAAVGTPVPFLSGMDAGYWDTSNELGLAVPGLAPGDTAFVQVRVWDKTQGATYETALAAGGYVGRSEIMEVTTGGAGTPPSAPAPLLGLTSFQLGRIPSILQQPRGKAILPGASLTLLTVVSSETPATYQWRLNGTPIPSATNETLFIVNAGSKDIGDYYLVAANLTGSATSAVASVWVSIPSSGGTVWFDNLESGQRIFDVDRVTPLAGNDFKAQLYAGLAPYALLPVGEPSPFLTGPQAGYWLSPSNGVVISNVPPGGLAYLQVRVWATADGATFEAAVANHGKFGASQTMSLVTGGSGTPAGPPAHLSAAYRFAGFYLNQTPAILQEPVGGDWYQGQSVLLQAVVASMTPIACQWFFASGPPGWVAIAGATNTAYALSNVNSNQAGYYFFTVANANGASTNWGAIVRVYQAPFAASVHFSNRVPSAGLDAPVYDEDGVTPLSTTRYLAQLYAGPSAGGLKPVGVAVDFSQDLPGHWRDLSNPARVIPGLLPGAVAYVQVRAWDSAAGSDYDQALAAHGRVGVSDVFTVVTGGAGIPPAPPAVLIGLNSFRLGRAPEILSQPSSQDLVVGQPLRLSVTATSVLPLSFQWQLGGANLVGATNATFTIDRVKPTDAGSYTVLVANSVAVSTSAVAVVTVHVPTSGGRVIFSNDRPAAGIQAPVFGLDGTTPLEGSAYVAQMYAGTNADALLKVTLPAPFQTGANAGYWDPGTNIVVLLPNVPPGGDAFIVIRVWRATDGPTFEQAVVNGGQGGSSAVIQVVAGGSSVQPLPDAELVGLQSFHLFQVPLVTKPPIGASVYEGQSVVLNPAVTGVSPLGFQWELNGLPIAGATNLTLTLTNLQVAQAGSYRLFITSPGGTARTPAADVIVNPVPAGATVQFVNRPPNAGVDAPVFDSDGRTPLAGAAFLAQLYAAANPTNLLPVGAAVPFLAGADAGYWDSSAQPWRTIPDVVPGALAYVQVRVWDAAAGSSYEQALAAGRSCGTSSVLEIQTGGQGTPPALPAPLTGLRSFHLIRSFNDAPEFLFQPLSQAAFVGQPAVFAALVSSDQPLSLQWQFQGTNIVGANSAVLSIPVVRPENLGTYVLVASNATGVRMSSPAVLGPAPFIGNGTLDMNSAPSVVGAGSQIFDIDGQTPLTGPGFLVQAFGGPTPDQLFPAGQPTTFKSGAGAGYFVSGTIYVPGGMGSSTAYVRIVAWDVTAGATPSEALANGGKVGSSTVLKVVLGDPNGSPPSVPASLLGLNGFRLGQLPSITKQPEDVAIFVGEQVVLGVTATSPLPLGYQWRFNGRALIGATDSVLVLTNTQQAQSGTYYVSVYTDIGSVASRQVQVTIAGIPTVAVVQFRNRAAGAGLEAPVYGADGQTRLAGDGYLAQLYVGTNADALAPVAGPAPFLTGADAGYWDPGAQSWRELPGFAPGTRLLAQVRAWAKAAGQTYELARTAGGLVGASPIFSVVAGGNSVMPPELIGLVSFGLATAWPVIVTGPVDQSTWVDGPAQFSAVVSSPSTPTYQWQRLIGSDRWQDVHDATNLILAFARVGWLDTGTYRLAVTNDAGSASSAPAHLSFGPFAELGPAQAHFAVPTGGPSSGLLTVQYTTNLVNWAELAPLSVTNGIAEWNDVGVTDGRVRVYRLWDAISNRVAATEAPAFMTLPIPPGFSMIGLPLLAGDNSVASVLAGMPEGTILYRFDPGTGQYVVNSYVFGSWEHPDDLLAPGLGVFVHQGTTNTYLIRIQGTLPQGNLVQSVPAGWSIQASQVPQAGPLDTTLGYVPSQGDTVVRFNNYTGQYVFYHYDAGWSGGDVPVLSVGEAFWIRKDTAGTWQRTFSVGQ